MPNTQLGPEVFPFTRLVQPATQGAELVNVAFEGGELLCSLQLGKSAFDGPRWLSVGIRRPVGQAIQRAGESRQSGIISPPEAGGGSDAIHIPEGNIIIAFALHSGRRPGLSCVWDRVVRPENFLGPEESGKFTKEPVDNGEGDKATKDGGIISGFEWLRDPASGTLRINIWYRPVL